MVHTLRSPSRIHPHPDAKRIAGITAAITVNALLLMLLLVPMRAPPTPALPTVQQTIQWVLLRPVTPPVPIHVPVAPAHPHPAVPVVRQSTPIALILPAPVILQAGSEPAVGLPSVETQADPGSGVQGAPLAGVRLEYDRAPAPAYPRDALRAGSQGTVLLQVLVDIDGKPLQVDIQRSSGDRRLDVVARRQVLEQWRFRPAMRDGHPIQAIGLVPIAFNLQ